MTISPRWSHLISELLPLSALVSLLSRNLQKSAVARGSHAPFSTVLGCHLPLGQASTFLKTEIQMIYNMELVSGVQQSDSVIFFFRLFSIRGYYKVLSIVPCCSSHFRPVRLFLDPMDCSPPGSSVHGISQARILEWVAVSFSRESFRRRDQTCISYVGRQILYTEPPGKPYSSLFYTGSPHCLSILYVVVGIC